MPELRAEIAELTNEIIRLIGQRNDLARKVGRMKTKVSLPAEDEKVEDSLLKQVIDECDRTGVERRAGLKVLKILLSESKRIQGVEHPQPPTPMSVFVKAVELQRKGVRMVRLDVGEPDFKPPKAVLEACAEALFSFKTHYTEARGIPELRAALRRYLSRNRNFVADEDEVAVTPSGKFAVYAALATLVREGESAIVIEPNWPAYKQVLQNIGAKAIVVRTELEQGWDIPVERIDDAVRPNTKAIVLSFPNNPTGKIISSSSFRAIVELADDRGLTVLSDEIYNEYSYRPCPSILETTPKKFVLTSSFSKTWAMTGFRVGYAVSSEELVSKISQITSLIVTSVPEFVQYAAIKALDSDDDVRKNVRTMKERIHSACDALDRINSLKYHRPDGAMYVFPRLTNESESGDRFSERLMEKGVSITPGSSFGDYPNFFRISLCQPEALIVEGIKRMGELLG